MISIKSYCHHLTSQVHPEYATEHLVRCSAADKAEAFLRTIGQWEEREMNQPHTPDNEVARLQAETDRLYIVAQEASESAQRKTNEIARLREELKISNNLDEHKAIRITELENEVARLREEIEIERQRVVASWNEIARLRELLNRAIEVAEDFQSNGHDTACYYEVNKFRCRCGFIDASDELDKIKAELARIAPAPEEPVGKGTLMTTPANHYWSTEGTRFLNPDSSIPTVEERVKAAF